MTQSKSRAAPGAHRISLQHSTHAANCPKCPGKLSMTVFNNEWNSCGECSYRGIVEWRKRRGRPPERHKYLQAINKPARDFFAIEVLPTRLLRRFGMSSDPADLLKRFVFNKFMGYMPEYGTIQEVLRPHYVSGELQLRGPRIPDKEPVFMVPVEKYPGLIMGFLLFHGENHTSLLCLRRVWIGSLQVYFSPYGQRENNEHFFCFDSALEAVSRYFMLHTRVGRKTFTYSPPFLMRLEKGSVS